MPITYGISYSQYKKTQVKAFKSKKTGKKSLAHAQSADAKF